MVNQYTLINFNISLKFNDLQKKFIPSSHIYNTYPSFNERYDIKAKKTV